MTAVALIIGTLPTSLGPGEDGEHNPPLGRAVIGGLLLATIATLFLAPVVHATLRKKAGHAPHELLAEELAESRAFARQPGRIAGAPDLRPHQWPSRSRRR